MERKGRGRGQETELNHRGRGLLREKGGKKRGHSFHVEDGGKEEGLGDQRPGYVLEGIDRDLLTGSPKTNGEASPLLERFLPRHVSSERELTLEGLREEDLKKRQKFFSSVTLNRNEKGGGLKFSLLRE